MVRRYSKQGAARRGVESFRKNNPLSAIWKAPSRGPSSWYLGLWIGVLPPVALPEDHAPGTFQTAGYLRGVGRQPAAFRAAGAGVASVHHAVRSDEYHTGYG